MTKTFLHRLSFLLILIWITGCEKPETARVQSTNTLATVTTSAVSAITNNSASSGGNITDDGGSSITARGICYSTTGSPALINNTVQSGSGTGSFTGNITNLQPGTTYFIRAFATNATGTSYGNEVQFRTTSIDSSAYDDLVYITAEDYGGGGTIYGIYANSGVIKWTTRIFTGGRYYSTPIISNGIMYIGTYKALNALNAKTGAVIWSCPFPEISDGDVISSPTLDNGVAYVASNNGYFYAVNMATGTIKWSFLLGAKSTSSPAIENGRIFFGCNDGYIYALNTAGTLLWKFTRPNLRFPGTAAVSNGKVFFEAGPLTSATNRTFFALDAATGNVVWSKDVTGRVGYGEFISTPTVTGNLVLFPAYFESPGNLYALDVNTGQEKWKFQTGSIVTECYVKGSTGYLGRGTTWEYYAIDITTGAQLWSTNFNLYSLTALNQYIASANTCVPTVSEKSIYIYQFTDKFSSTLYSYDISSRNLLWSRTVSGMIKTNATVLSRSGTLFRPVTASFRELY